MFTKREAIKEIFRKYVNKNSIVITSCGIISREAYAVVNDKGSRFYRFIPLTGSMGMCMSLSLGLAIAEPDKEIIVIMGDGEYMMGYNALLNISKSNVKNFKHFVLVDYEYESTGGQPNAFSYFCVNDSNISWYTDVKYDLTPNNPKKTPIGFFINVDESDKPIAPRVPDKELQILVKERVLWHTEKRMVQVKELEELEDLGETKILQHQQKKVDQDMEKVKEKEKELEEKDNLFDVSKIKKIRSNWVFEGSRGYQPNKSNLDPNNPPGKKSEDDWDENFTDSVPEPMGRKPTVVFVTGTFDLLHWGHVEFLKKAKKFGDILIVGVHNDKAVMEYKGNYPILDIYERLKVVSTIKYVDYVTAIPTQAELGKGFYKAHNIDYQVQGEDNDDYSLPKELGIFRLVEYTKGISSTAIKWKVAKRFLQHGL